MKRLREISDRIETLAATLPQPIPPRLAHFLDRRSYDKALEFLEDKAPLSLPVRPHSPARVALAVLIL